jgi:hypothetical protein
MRLEPYPYTTGIKGIIRNRKSNEKQQWDILYYYSGKKKARENDVTSGHVTDVTSGHATDVTSGHVTDENVYNITCVDPVYVTQTTIAVTIVHKIHYSIEVHKTKQKRIIGFQDIIGFMVKCINDHTVLSTVDVHWWMISYWSNLSIYFSLVVDW